jgi:hypothetical protein
MIDSVQSYLELATDYAQSGFYKDAVEVLNIIENKNNSFPMLIIIWDIIGQ